MKSNRQLLSNIIGQLNGIDRMIEDDKDCFETLTQMKAARSALDTFIERYISEHFEACLLKANKGEKDEVCKKFFSEIIRK
jgi:DNA-binding FrmR family transcriptional regulator